jgi:hypothetical protein
MGLLPRDHRLARGAAVSVTELRQDPAYQEQCQPVGDEILDRVTLSRLITVVGTAAADRLTSELPTVPATDLPATTLALGWSPSGIAAGK